MFTNEVELTSLLMQLERHVDEQELGTGRDRHFILEMVLLKQSPSLIIPPPDSVLLYIVQGPHAKEG